MQPTKDIYSLCFGAAFASYIFLGLIGCVTSTASGKKDNAVFNMAGESNDIDTTQIETTDSEMYGDPGVKASTAIVSGIATNNQEAALLQQRSDQHKRMLAENSRLIHELRQRGIDVRESERGVVVNLPDVLFDFGRASLTAQAREIIAEIALILQRAPSRQLLIEGHTDSVGTIQYNHKLSEGRARAVAKALEVNGISRETLSTQSFGETTPIASNRTELGRQQNRRVEVIIRNM